LTTSSGGPPSEYGSVGACAIGCYARNYNPSTDEWSDEWGVGSGVAFGNERKFCLGQSGIGLACLDLYLFLATGRHEDAVVHVVEPGER